MDQDDTERIKKVSKMVSLEEDCNVHIARLTQSNQKPGSNTPLSHNVDVDMLQLTFPHNVQLKASCVTPSNKPKVTRSQKRSPIVTSQVEVPKVKKRKEIKDSLQESRLGDDEDMNEFEPFTKMEKIICNYIFNKNFERSEVLVSLKYEYGDRAAFNTLLHNQWISSQIINLFVCKMRMEENRYKDMFVWYLPTHFAKKMLEEDGNPTLEWFKRTYRDDDKHMSNLMKCEQIFIPMNDDNSHWYLCVVDFVKRVTYILDSLQSTTSEVIQTKNVKTVVTGLDKLSSFLEKDKYIDSIIIFKLKSPVSNPQQNNGYDCGMYVIKHMFTNTSWRHLPLLISVWILVGNLIPVGYIHCQCQS
nr:putative ubiquitin-like-specific protease 1B isoform X1 [Quercus suber]XP_023898935.1 putative ubiquitin-like-specific protease 1B isoform X1 [Quercus suber]XP_023898936.1 putative ubiquitin-like-specific protease 1B isoform X1 [Quercus suber]XP_023898937.1 putative ubiquitin-like-specific protease 1B isoform X1 [Quercus suber]XP_023898938.1 putative ubiquitin-like-specific protease 1B isoform X1 [Quercus suber]XP_023898939.1 putative ubiquitin-like-specific protease 1B isoform X1 [Quercus 